VHTLRSLPARWTTRLAASPVGAVIVYHRVGGETSGDPKREILPAISGKDFRRQLEHVCRTYAVVRAADIVAAAGARRARGPFPVAITFDDDLQSHAREAREVLSEMGLTATFFLTGASLAGPHSFWWEDLQRVIDARLVSADAIPYVPAEEVEAALARTPKAIFGVAHAIMHLERAQRDEVTATLRAVAGPSANRGGLREADVRALVQAGFDVGFHTVQHDALTLLTDDALDEALHTGRERLAAAAGVDVDLIAYPHGMGDARVAHAARAAGFTRGFVTGRRAVRHDDDSLLIPRLVPPADPGKLALRIARALRDGN
jgi:peptidoglycan/xylan/chitin deacetylase (PgdA/CDA1 family)